VDSTNRYCETLDLQRVDDFTCYWALEQTAGIGQRGNHWESAPGENLTFSLVLHPTFLPAASQFRLTQALSLGVADFLEEGADGLDDFKGLKGFKGSKGSKDIKETLVKWPNDVYVGGGKICGMLVSNRLQGDVLDTAICGIGLNVNQRRFPEWVPHPTSLALLTGEKHDLEPTLLALLGHIGRRYDELRRGRDLEPEYLGRMMNYGVAARYRHHDKEITATITGVDRYGHLLLTTDEGEKLCCAMKEIEFIV